MPAASEGFCWFQDVSPSLVQEPDLTLPFRPWEVWLPALMAGLGQDSQICYGKQWVRERWAEILCYPWVVQAFSGLRVPLLSSAFRTVKYLICFVFPEFWSTWTITLWNTILMKIPSSCRLKRLEDLTSSLWLRSKITDPLWILNKGLKWTFSHNSVCWAKH